MSQPWNKALPKGWKTKPLWSEFRRVKTLGTGEETLLSVYRDYGVVPREGRDDNNNKPSEDLSKYQLVRKGNLVVNKMKAWQGSLAISQHDGIVSPAYFVYQPCGNLDPEFTHYLLRSKEYFSHWGAISSGVRPAQWDLDPSAFNVTPLLVPPQKVQVEISSFLDRETAEIDAFIAESERLIELLNERRTAAITQAVTKGLNPDAPMKDSGIEWLGEVPKHWDVRSVKAYGMPVLGKMIQEKQLAPTEKLAPYIRAANVQPGGVLDLSTTKEMWFSPSELNTLTLKTGDVVIVEGGAGHGRPALVGEGLETYGFQNSIIRVRPLTQTHGAFLLYSMLSMVSLGYVEMVSSVASIPHFTKEKVAATPLTVPPLEEMKTIVDHLDRVTAEIGSAIATAREAIALARERRQALISAAVTGKIDVRSAL